MSTDKMLKGDTRRNTRPSASKSNISLSKTFYEPLTMEQNTALENYLFVTQDICGEFPLSQCPEYIQTRKVVNLIRRRTNERLSTQIKYLKDAIEYNNIMTDIYEKNGDDTDEERTIALRRRGYKRDSQAIVELLKRYQQGV